MDFANLNIFRGLFSSNVHNISGSIKDGPQKSMFLRSFISTLAKAVALDLYIHYVMNREIKLAQNQLIPYIQANFRELEHQKSMFGKLNTQVNAIDSDHTKMKTSISNLESSIQNKVLSQDQAKGVRQELFFPDLSEPYPFQTSQPRQSSS